MMLESRRGPALAVAAVWMLGAGCTTLREIPPSAYAARPERKDVRLLTRDGLDYEFDYVRIARDSLTGFRRRDVEGPVDDEARLSVPLSDVQKLSARSVDWKRTGLIGGGVIAVVAAAGLKAASKNSSGSDDSGGGKIGGVP